MKMRNYGVALSAILLTCASAQADELSFVLTMDGPSIVGGGDVDGTAMGTITFSPGTNQISWSLEYMNLDEITGWGIGLGAAGVGTATDVNINVGAPGGSGTYEGIANAATTATQNFILSQGDEAFFVIKTTRFPDGAIRGQLGTKIPAPGAMCVFGLAGLAAARRRR